MNKQQIDERAMRILQEQGYNIDIQVNKGWDRRNFLPDYVSYRLSKYDQMMFRTELRADISGDVYDADGTQVLADCLKVRENESYQRQANHFDLKIAQLLKLREEHKFSKFGEKKVLKQECEELMAYRQDFSPLESDGIYANIPLIEENVKEIKSLIEKINEACKEAENQLEDLDKKSQQLA